MRFVLSSLLKMVGAMRVMDPRMLVCLNPPEANAGLVEPIGKMAHVVCASKLQSTSELLIKASRK